MVMTAFGLERAVVFFLSTYFYRRRPTLSRRRSRILRRAARVLQEPLRSFFETISFTVISLNALMQGVLYYFVEIAVPMGRRIPRWASVWWPACSSSCGGGGLGVKLSVRIMALVFRSACFVIMLFGRLLVPALVGFFASAWASPAACS
jgi:hypothetical protein